jgi:alanyl-tRNA synthetase
MTQRLYYNDPYKRAFDASIVGTLDHQGRPAMELDQTAFYPTSGGQPFDTGTLAIAGGAVVEVVDVVDSDAGGVLHVLAEMPAGAAPGQQVHGEIAWSRRFDHMQQHTGQHLLSAAFDRLFAARTVSFHLGVENCTIDLSREAAAHEIAAAEAEANRIIWEDRPVSIRFVTSDEAARLPLRKEPAREGLLRLIDIDGFDLSACGGTHVARTGAVGLIAATGWERFKGGQRVEFVGGSRAFARFQSLRDHVAAATRRLSVPPGEIASAVERLQHEAKDLRRASLALKTDLAGFRAAEMEASADRVGQALAVCRVLEGDMSWFKLLAAAFTARPGRIAVLVSKESPAGVVVAASPDTDVAANSVLAHLTTSFGGRGGGKADLAQGGGLTADPEAVVECAWNLIAKLAQAELINTDPSVRAHQVP